MGELRRKSLDADPFAQFAKWFAEAGEANIKEPNGCALATADREGRPSCRHVLMKGLTGDGVTFFTNYESRKARELLENPRGCMVFWWRELDRQVIIEGTVEKSSREESVRYFSSRHRLSQLSASASHQDAVIASREVLEREVDRLDDLYSDEPIPLPPFWGGFVLRPNRFEFWQGREGRLHDRFEYVKSGLGWKIERLSP